MKTCSLIDLPQTLNSRSVSILDRITKTFSRMMWCYTRRRNIAAKKAVVIRKKEYHRGDISNEL